MALGKLFEISGKIIIPKEDCYIIKPIANMMDAYEDDKLKLVAYLHYMCSLRKDDNPYADVPESDKHEQIVKDLELFDVDFEDVIIIRALACVKEKYETTFYILYNGIKIMLEKIGKRLATIDPDFASRDGNSTGILSVMKSYETLNKSFKAAYSDYEEENGNIKVRGGGKTAFDENDRDEFE